MSLVDCNHLLFTNLTWWGVSNSYYSDLCFNNSHDLFGCVGLKKKEYCILNKPFLKSEYEDLLKKIIEHMTKTGEFGNLFPMKYSPINGDFCKNRKYDAILQTVGVLFNIIFIFV